MTVRFGIIGCGKITERLALPQLTACADASVTALVDVDRSLAQRLADQFHLEGVGIWTDWRRMLREADVDAVGVCVPNALHAEMTIAFLEAGKHVMVEKPMTTSLAEADAMIAASHANRRWLMVEQTQRFEPAHEVARALIQSGILGRITQLRGRLGHGGPEYWTGAPTTWFTDRRLSGGGVLVDVGIHILDLLRWLSGKEVKRICCQAKTLAKPVAVEDNASALLEFTDGTMGSFEVSWTTHPYEVATVVYGERGTLRTALGGGPPVAVRFCQLRGDPNEPLGEPFCPEIPSASRVGGAYPYFVRCILQNERPFLSGEEGRASLEVMLAAYESIRTGGWVELPLRRRRK